jgi:hypothetical protein
MTGNISLPGGDGVRGFQGYKHLASPELRQVRLFYIVPVSKLSPPAPTHLNAFKNRVAKHL